MSYYVREPRGVECRQPKRSQARGPRGGASGARRGASGGARRSPAAGLAAPRWPRPCSRASRSPRRSARTGSSAEVLEHVAAFEPLPEPPDRRLATSGSPRRWPRGSAIGVRLGAEVRSLDELDADHVILAVPLPALARVRAAATGSARRSTASEMGHAAKLHVPLARPAPTSAVMSVPGRYWCWTVSRDTDGVLNCFAGSPGAARAGSVGQGPAMARSRVTCAPSRPGARGRRGPHHAGPTAPTARPACAPGPQRGCSPRPPGACGSRASTPRGRGPG